MCVNSFPIFPMKIFPLHLAEWFMSWSSSWDTTHYEMPILYYMMLFLFYIPQSHRFEIAAV
jgi:hypothetical protein